METSSKLIPSSKKDWDAIYNLQKARPEQIIALADDLLPWLQDMNWPIADSIQALLLPYVNSISSSIARILNESNDDVWKYWIINVLLSKVRLNQLNPLIVAALSRIASNPTIGEEEENLVEITRSLLDSGELS